MNREISEDFFLLRKFISEFNLEDVLKNDKFIHQIKPMHKKLYSYMTFIAEVDHRNPDEHIYSDNGIDYLKESVSDLSQAFFCWVQGAYKPANLILRSSIETFIKASVGEEQVDIYQQKSMFKVFEMSTHASCFDSDLCKKSLSSLHSTYSILCEFAHSAYAHNLAQVSALRCFPSFDINESTSFYNNFINIISNILSTLYINNYRFVHTMHPKNCNNFLSGLPSSTKKMVNFFIGK